MRVAGPTLWTHSNERKKLRKKEKTGEEEDMCQEEKIPGRKVKGLDTESSRHQSKRGDGSIDGNFGSPCGRKN